MNLDSINWQQAGNVAAVVSAIGVLLLLIIYVAQLAFAGRGEAGESGGNETANLLYRLAERIKNEPAIVAAAVSAVGVFLVQTEVLTNFDDATANYISGLIIAAAGFYIRARATPVKKVEESGFKYDKDDDKWRRQR